MNLHADADRYYFFHFSSLCRLVSGRLHPLATELTACKDFKVSLICFPDSYTCPQKPIVGYLKMIIEGSAEKKFISVFLKRK